jgi:hypothetical protein
MRKHFWPLYRAYLQRSKRPIIVGPFRGEVGFEALYWVPFLRALGLPKERLTVITRGGAHLWYPAHHNVELYDLRDPRDVRVENLYQQKQTGMLKQMRVSVFDKAVVKDAAAQLGLKKYDVLHPAWMYQTLDAFWQGDTGLSWLMDRITPEPLPMVQADGLTLPDEYVAVRFYYRHTFPVSDVTKTIAIETIKELAKRHTVVVLNAEVHADEHADVPLPDLPNVFQLKGMTGLTPQNNLAIQSAVLSKAIGFVGTYGGLAQLATMFRKPTVSFYTDWGGTALAHQALGEAMAKSFGVAAQVIRVQDIALLREVLPAVTLETSRPSTGTVDPVFSGQPALQ